MATSKNKSVNRMSPREKMINLMYIVLTAMLALLDSLQPHHHGA